MGNETYRNTEITGRAFPSSSTEGAMYAIGHGVPQDYVKAHMWWNLAAAQSSGEAREKRDLLTKMLPPSQVADAQHRAREKVEDIHDE